MRLPAAFLVVLFVFIGAPAGAEPMQTVDSDTGSAPADTALAEESSTKARLAEQEEELKGLREQMELLNRRVAELEADSLGAASSLEERLRRLETSVESQPELPPEEVSAGDFPGSLRIPGTDAAIKIGGFIWAAFVESFDALGSEDRFLTFSIPVTGTPEAGKGSRLSFWANPSRLNFDVRTPTEVGPMRAYIEGDFAGSSDAFRLRHAYGQYSRVLLGKTWSTFSDPDANHEDLDFEGINAENVQRQAQFRYTFHPGEDWKVALAVEQPIASFSGAASVSQVPDLVVGLHRSWDDSHLYASIVARQLRGEPENRTYETVSGVGLGGSVSGDISLPVLEDQDRIVFQMSVGRGIARYINDLNSAGEQEAVYDSTAGELRPLSHWGFYVALEHHWGRADFLKGVGFNDLRSSLIWGYVNVDNLDIQPSGAYRRTHRVSFNLLWSPVPRIDLGTEYIWGQRENKDGATGEARQLQFRSRFKF